MITVSKISNQDEGFILTYYNNGQSEIIIVDGGSIVAELNEAFATLKKAQDESAKKQSEKESQHTQGVSYSGGALNMGDSIGARTNIRASKLTNAMKDGNNHGN